MFTCACGFQLILVGLLAKHAIVFFKKLKWQVALDAAATQHRAHVAARAKGRVGRGGAAGGGGRFGARRF